MALLFLPCLTHALGSKEVTHYYQNDALMWERLFVEPHPMGPQPSATWDSSQPAALVVGGIVPHHDLMLREISRYWQGLAELRAGERSPSTVVLISPDHFERGGSDVLVPQGNRFSTPDGVLDYSADLAKSLIEMELAMPDQELWKGEHGIFAHTPFIMRYFPRARFLPLAVRIGTSYEVLEELAKGLAELLPDDALVVASVDFSHYQIKEIADIHDITSETTLVNSEYPLMAGLEIDSPESVTTLALYAQAKEAEQAVMVGKSSSYDYARNPLGETTSHQYWMYFQGPRLPWRKTLTMFVAGAMEVPMDIGIGHSWAWDRFDTSPVPGMRLLKNLAGKEARFLMGLDLYLMDIPPGRHMVSKHGQNIIIDSVDATEAGWSLSTGLRLDSDLSFLVVENADAEWKPGAPDDGVNNYDLVVLRAGEGSRLFYRDQPMGISGGESSWTMLDLGTLVDPGQEVKGMITFLVWDGFSWTNRQYAYVSPEGVPPMIHQFQE